MGDAMPFAHGNSAVHADMQIDIENESHLANKTFLHLPDAVDRAGCLLHQAHDGPARGGIHDLLQSGFEQAIAVDGDQPAGEESGPAIGTLPAFPADEGGGNPNERCRRGERIGAMMPGVCLHGGALDVAAHPDDVAIHQFLDDDHDHEHDEGKGRGSVMRHMNFPHALNGNAQGGSQHTKGNDNGGDGLSFAVTVGVRRVRRPRGQLEPSPDDHRPGNVERRFNPVCDEHVGIAEEARQNFGGGHEKINDQAEKSHARAGLQIAGSDVRCRIQRRGHL